jgi:hypothetical protein
LSLSLLYNLIPGHPVFPLKRIFFFSAGKNFWFFFVKKKKLKKTFQVFILEKTFLEKFKKSERKNLLKQKPKPGITRLCVV